MWVFNWFWNILKSLGLANKSAKILFLGLDNAGKTTLLHMLRDNRLVQHKPTRNPTSEELYMGRVCFQTYDLGGHKEARRLWKDYFGSVDGVVYLVDASSTVRAQESKRELDALLADPDLQATPFCILGNKIDLPSAFSEPQFREAMGLHQTTGKSTIALPDNMRPIEVFMCSIVERQGYSEGFNWLAQYL
jgi:GTP-binding protein SAR1